MRFLVTGSSGHLGEGLIRTLRAQGREVRGLDRLASPTTEHVGSLADADFVRACLQGVDCVLHTATLHKPHLVTHSASDFVETNVQGTLNVLEGALAAGCSSVVFTSTTSAFGEALRPEPGQPAAWVDEAVQPVPRNVYGVTKVAAEDLCELHYRRRGLPCLVLRTSRFFVEADDDPAMREHFSDANLKANEYSHRRVDLADVVDAQLLAAERAPALGFGRYVISATTPFAPEHLAALGRDAASVMRELFPDCEPEYRRRGWSLLPRIDRVYVNARAREELGWRPRFDFRHVLERLREDEEPWSELALAVGSKGYHDEVFEDGPYPVERAEA